MIRRIEFTLNLDNPSEAALYEALTDLLRHRRAGEVIRQALTAHFFESAGRAVQVHTFRPVQLRNHDSADIGDDSISAEQIVAQTSAMFGF